MLKYCSLGLLSSTFLECFNVKGAVCDILSQLTYTSYFSIGRMRVDCLGLKDFPQQSKGWDFTHVF